VAVALSQHKEASPTPGTSQTVTLGTATTAGDLVVLAVSNSGAGGDPTITGLGATWTKLADDGSAAFQVWKGVGCSGGQTIISLTYSSSSATCDYTITVWSGAAVESSNSAQGTSNTPATSSVTPSAAGRVVVGGWMMSNLFDTWGTYVDAPSAWTDLVDMYVGQARRHHIGYISGTTTSTSESATNTATRTWFGYAVLLAPASAPPASPPPQRGHVYRRAVSRAAVI
jgi:hypothetical protein